MNTATAQASAGGAARRTHHRVAIIGTGFAGLAMAMRLRGAGMHDFVVFERASEVGGTWRDNTYPGAACDVPSHLYSFSFAPNPNWTRAFSDQGEIQQYLRDCTDRFGVRPHIRFNSRVDAIRWDERRQLWDIDVAGETFTAQFVVGGMGALSEPSIPPLKGLDTFEGTIFHSAQWDHDHDLTGERVAVVGTGASSIQFVPQIAGTAASIDLYQRTAPWIIPRRNRRIGRFERWLYRRVPALQHVLRAGIYWGREMYVLGFTGPRKLMRIPERIARHHLRKQVPDPILREKVTPEYTIGCKRILISSDYYPALSRDDVEVVPFGVTQVRPHSVVAADGVERPADTIIFGTGFHVTDYPAGRWIFGRGGTALSDVWRDGMEAHVGATVPGFPNLFLLVGPNTGLGHTSMVLMIEAQVTYILSALRHMVGNRLRTLEVRPEALRAYNDELQAKLQNTVWTTGGCASWYLDDTGRNTTLWPDFTWRFADRARRFDVAAYTFTPAIGRDESVVSLLPEGEPTGERVA